MKTKILFMGSSEYSLVILKNLIKKFPVALVVTQPDKPSGRGKRVEPALIKAAANEMNISTLQPKKINDDSFWEIINAHSIDLIIVAAYGKILPKKLLEFPKYGCLNVHASLLPRWRGASPIQAAILNGDTQTGVTIMKMDEGIDTGPVLSDRAINIESSDTSNTLMLKLAQAGSELLVETLPEYLSGKITPQPQNSLQATYTGLLKKEDGILDFSQPAENLERKIRAYNPWPICFMKYESTFIRIHKAEVSNQKSLNQNQRGISHKYPSIGTSTNDLILLRNSTCR